MWNLKFTDLEDDNMEFAGSGQSYLVDIDAVRVLMTSD
jgi:hypothetical protein